MYTHMYYIYIYISLSIYIYIYIYILGVRVQAPLSASGQIRLRPISLLRLSLLRLPDSNIPGNPLWAWEFPPLRIKILLESEPPNSRILRRLAVARFHTGVPASRPRGPRRRGREKARGPTPTGQFS